MRGILRDDAPPLAEAGRVIQSSLYRKTVKKIK